VHRVLVEVLDRDGLEGPEAHVQGDAGDVAAAYGEAAEDRVREVKAGRGRRDGPVVPGIDGLIAIGVVGLVLALDVGRERDVAAGADGRRPRLGREVAR
jgi:hypothetical protein